MRLVSVFSVEKRKRVARASPPYRPRGDGLAHRAGASRSTVATLCGKISIGAAGNRNADGCRGSVRQVTGAGKALTAEVSIRDDQNKTYFFEINSTSLLPFACQRIRCHPPFQLAV